MERTERDLLVRLDEKMEAVLKWQQEHIHTHQQDSRRLSALEVWRWKYAGAVGVVVTLLTIVGNLLTRIFLKA